MGLVSTRIMKHLLSSERAPEKYLSGDIAIIGMSARLPGVDSISEFWDRIAEGTDLIRVIPEQRKKDINNYLTYIGHKKNIYNFEEGAYLKHIDEFDYGFFNISPNEAAFMDPGQRLFLETAWETIEDAGYSNEQIMGSDTAVFVGTSNEAEYKKIIYDVVEPSFYPMSVQGNLAPFIASRISYLLDLKGPSMVINTLCSSSLVALHLGCQSIINGECSMALIGGVHINLLPIRPVKIGIESQSGRTRTFDRYSDGTGSGEGIIAVLLKPLGKALKDKDNIYAVIKGSAYNQDGASVGLTAPNPVAQEDVIIKAWQKAGIDPETISYIEAHGTGTRLGDPIEIDGIQRAFKRYTDKKQFCAIGSVKSNIGHLDAAAGLAGLLKAVLSLQKGQIPPTINFDSPNKLIAFHESPVYVNTKLRTWETDGYPKRCGVSSFGFSGTNCHVVLEEAPHMAIVKDKKEENFQILTLSAKNVEVLSRLVMLYSELDYDTLGWDNVCYSSCIGRSHFTCRLAIIVESKQDLIRKLKRVNQLGLKGSSKVGIYYIGIYYNEHKIVNDNDLIKKQGEVTNEEKRVFDCQASSLLDTIKSRDDLNGEKLMRICELYVKGAKINWEILYQFDNMKKVRLPLYPFKRKRCWVDIADRGNSNYESLYHKIEWRQRTLYGQKVARRKGVKLIISNNPMIQRLTKLLDSNVIEVILAKEFKKENDRMYFISDKKNDFIRLINDIGINSVTQIIYYISPYEINGDIKPCFEEKVDRVIYNFFNLIQSLISKKLNELDIVLLGNCVNGVDGSETEITPEYAALFGIGKTVNVEDYRINCRCVDIDDNTSMNVLLHEVLYGWDHHVAYRKGTRYIPEIVEINPQKVKNRDSQIKENGVYIITGGMGGIGLNIALSLSSKSKVNIILVNRTDYTGVLDCREELDKNGSISKKINMISKIKEKGSTVELYVADVSKHDEVSRLLDYTRSKYVKINGVIHSAAIGIGKQGKNINEECLDDFTYVISPKIYGVCLLEEYTKDDDLDFFVVFSSPITLMGAIGSVSYTSANAYLESFAEARNISKKNTVCISWAPWEETVLAFNNRFRENNHMFRMISTEDLINSFELIMTKDMSSVIAGRIDYQSDFFYLSNQLPFYLSKEVKSKIKISGEDNKFEAGSSSIDILPDVTLKGKEDTSCSETEKYIAAIWGQTLGYTELQIDENYYELGGDSINAMKIINKINIDKNMDLKVKDLLSNSTIREFAEYVDSMYVKLNSRNYLPLPKADMKSMYLVSMAQKRMYLLTIRRHRDISWNMSWVFNINGYFDAKKLEHAFESLVERHEILRTSFRIIKNDIVQIIEDSVQFSIDCQELDNRNIDQVVREFIRPFDLDKAPLLRVALVKVNDREHYLLFDIHHLIADAASMQIMLRDISIFYKGDVMPDMSIQYKDYSEWQNKLFASGFYQKQRDYWMSKLSNALPKLELPVAFFSADEENQEGNKLHDEIEEDLSIKLKHLSETQGVSLFISLISVFYALIYKVSSQSEISIGVPISGRNHPDLENLIGVFINIIVLKCTLKSEMSFTELMTEVNLEFLESCDNCDYPYFELVKELKTLSGSKKDPVSDILFVMQNTGARDITLEDGLTITPYEHVNLVSRNDMLLEAAERDNKIHLIFEYNATLYSKNTIRGLLNLYKSIISEVCRNHNIKLSDLRNK
ncbi:SDR family NAD(P)-dependent oxidoreductase [Enterocloster clostridioformis]